MSIFCMHPNNQKYFEGRSRETDVSVMTIVKTNSHWISRLSLSNN